MGCFTSKPINANKQTSMRLSQKVRYYHDLDVAALKKFFDLYDADGDGYISQDDFQRVLLKTGMSLTPERLDWLVMAADKNGDGKIDFAEFLNIESYPLLLSIRWLFFELDIKGDHFLTREEVEEYLEKPKPGEVPGNVIKAVFEELDKHEDQRLTYKEFYHLMLEALFNIKL